MSSRHERPFSILFVSVLNETRQKQVMLLHRKLTGKSTRLFIVAEDKPDVPYAGLLRKRVFSAK